MLLFKLERYRNIYHLTKLYSRVRTSNSTLKSNHISFWHFGLWLHKFSNRGLETKKNDIKERERKLKFRNIICSQGIYFGGLRVRWNLSSVIKWRRYTRTFCTYWTIWTNLLLLMLGKNIGCKSWCINAIINDGDYNYDNCYISNDSGNNNTNDIRRQV